MTTERLEAEAHTAWANYQSTCMTGGTPEQRRWAFERANHAEDKLAAQQRIEQRTRSTANTTELPAVKAEA